MPGVIGALNQLKPDKAIVSEIAVDGFEQLRAATPSTKSEIIQVEAGRMRGNLKHATVSGLGLGFGSFSRGLISRGVYSSDRVTIGLRWDGGSDGNKHFRIWSPGVEHDTRYYGGASFAAISASIDDVARYVGSDARLGDPDVWRTKTSLHVNAEMVTATTRKLLSIMSAFDKRATNLTQLQADFWKFTILEAAMAAVADSECQPEFVSSPLKLVRKAQEQIARSGSNPIHIATLVGALRVSRRSLHRAFNEVLGMPPITYLRHKRLCEARLLLKEGNLNITVADVAFSQGFSDFGRFAGYYRLLFGENPSDTLRKTRPGEI